MSFNNFASKAKQTLASLLTPEKLAAAAGVSYDTLDSMLASFAGAFTQHNRLITLQIADGTEYPELFLPQRVEGTESLSSGYKYNVTCLSPCAFIPLESMLGQTARIDILASSAGPFDFGASEIVTRCGVITAAKSLPSDGGFAKYLLTIEPPLSLLRHRRTSRVFQDMSVPDIVRQILKEHISTNISFARILKQRYELYRDQDYQPRSYCIQYRETDLAFIERILAEEGLPYWYQHESDGEIHTVTFVVFDDPYGLRQSAQGEVRFHRAEATEAEDSITEWTEAQRIGPAATTLTSFEYKGVRTSEALESTRNATRAETTLEDFDPQTLYYGRRLSNVLDRYVLRRQESHDWEKGNYFAQGNMRQLLAGQWFVLNDHPFFDKFLYQESREFVAYALSFCANNNLPSDLLQYVCPKNPEPSKQPPYWVKLSARHRGLPLAPAFSRTVHAKPTAPGLQTATVVGPKGEEIYTDSMGRIKIQFHWQRPKEHPEFGADFDELSSCWIRVAYPSAGASWGSQFIPRIGQEVLVDYLESDMDRPVIVGVIHNGSQHNPWFSDAGRLPANRALSGIKTKERFGEQYNELLFDDSKGQVRTKLSSEHGKTQINQGYLIHPRKDGKGAARGSGVEVRTDRHAALRAAEGVLLSTEAKQNAAGKQMDREQALAQLEEAQNLAQTLADTAEHQEADIVEIGPELRDKEGAGEGEATNGHLDHMVNAVKSWEAGTNTDPKSNSATGGQDGCQPIVVMSGAQGVGMATPKEMVFSAKKNLDMISQRDTQQTTLRRWIHNVTAKISLFVHGVAGKVNLKLITAKGHALFQARAGDIEIAGDKSLHIDACKQKLTVTAEKELVLASGGGYIRLKGGNIEIHCPGPASFKASMFDLSGPANMKIARDKYDEPGGCDSSSESGSGGSRL